MFKCTGTYTLYIISELVRESWLVDLLWRTPVWNIHYIPKPFIVSMLKHKTSLCCWVSVRVHTGFTFNVYHTVSRDLPTILRSAPNIDTKYACSNLSLYFACLHVPFLLSIIGWRVTIIMQYCELFSSFCDRGIVFTSCTVWQVYDSLWCMPTCQI